MSVKFPRPADDVGVIEDALWTRVLETVERLDKLSVSPPLSLHDTPAGKVITVNAAARTLVTVFVDTAAAGAGKYDGHIVRDETAEVDPATDLAASEVGGVGEDVLILNTIEINGAGHMLTDTTQQRTHFIGRILPRRATDGRRVVLIDGFDIYDCPEEEGGGESLMVVDGGDNDA